MSVRRFAGALQLSNNVLGDMDGDFYVTVADCPLLVEALVNRPAYDAHLYDIDGSGTFDSSGLQRLATTGQRQCGAAAECNGLLADSPSLGRPTPGGRDGSH